MIVSPGSSFGGVFVVPGDKSVSHRLALLGAVANGRTEIANFGSARDNTSTLDCLRALGVGLRQDGHTVVVDGHGWDGLRAPTAPLDAGNSGSTIRMLAGVLAGRPFTTVVDGDASLRTRPMERIAQPLRAMGAAITSRDGRPPLRITGGRLHGSRFELPVASAQVKTAILLAGLQADGETTVVEPARSRDHTERWLPVFGGDVVREGTSARVVRTDLRAASVVVPGDVSSAAFLVAAALLAPRGNVRVEGVGLNPGRTAFLDVLQSMGADVRWAVTGETPEPVGWIEARSGPLRGVEVPETLVPSLIDEAPALAAIATAASGTFVLRGAAELRLKESDRIAALADVLGRMGARVTEQADGLRIEGGAPLRGARVSARGDHRIAMAAAVAGLAAVGDTHVEDGDCVAVSFPEFPCVLAEGLRHGA